MYALPKARAERAALLHRSRKLLYNGRDQLTPGGKSSLKDVVQGLALLQHEDLLLDENVRATLMRQDCTIGDLRRSMTGSYQPHAFDRPLLDLASMARMDATGPIDVHDRDRIGGLWSMTKAVTSMKGNDTEQKLVNNVDYVMYADKVSGRIAVTHI